MSTIEKAMAKREKVKEAQTAGDHPAVAAGQRDSLPTESPQYRDEAVVARPSREDRMFSIDAERLREMGMISNSASLKKRDWSEMNSVLLNINY